jgi:hypothetical protein
MPDVAHHVERVEGFRKMKGLSERRFRTSFDRIPDWRFVFLPCCLAAEAFGVKAAAVAVANINNVKFRPLTGRYHILRPLRSDRLQLVEPLSPAERIGVALDQNVERDVVCGGALPVPA